MSNIDYLLSSMVNSLRVEYLHDQSNFTLDGNADTEIDEGAKVGGGYWEESEVEIPCVMDPNVLSAEQEAPLP